jgi:two-component system NarL family sensor kinase
MRGAQQDQIDGSTQPGVGVVEESRSAPTEGRSFPPTSRPGSSSARRGRWRWRRDQKRSRRLSAGLALVQFAAAGVVAFVVLAMIGVHMLRQAAVHEAISRATIYATDTANQRFSPAVTDALANGDPAAVAVADRIAREHLLSDRVVRVKLWTREGRIVYSDEPRLINEVFPLDAQDLALLKSGPPDASLSDLHAPENQYEHSFGRLLQIYERVKTASGRPMLLELYLRFDSVTASAKALGSAVAPAFLLALLALEILQVPLAWRLVRRIGAGHRERQALSRRALEASDHERKRIARDLHDGVVQSLAGVSYALTAVGAQLSGTGVAHLTGTVEAAARSTRQNIGQLRSLIFDINPPSLQRIGLPAAIGELTMSLTEAGILVTVDAPTSVSVSEERAAAFYRAAQEAVRNVLSHSQASTVQVELKQEVRRVVLTIADDGVGFDVVHHATDSDRPHFGLGLLDDMATESGGKMQVRSAPGCGTTIRFELPPT